MALQNYSKTTWENTPSTATPLNAANLNHIEAGIKAVTDAVIAMHSAGISPENIAATIVNAVKLPNGSENELVKVNSSGNFARSGAFVSNDQTKIIDNSSVEKYVPTARAVAKKLGSYPTTNDMYTALDNAFSGNSSNEPALLLDDTVDQTSNPDGDLILYYIDSEDVRHNIFNFSQVLCSNEAATEMIDTALSGDSYGMNMTLNLDNNVDMGANPNGHLMLYYIDSDWTRHNVFDFTPYLENYVSSAVVNQNGTITFTLDDGSTFTTTGSSVIGSDGFSPTVSTTSEYLRTRVEITDVNGTQNIYINDGESVKSAVIDANGDLIITIKGKPTSGVRPTYPERVYNVGHVVGADGSDYILTAQDKSDIADLVLAELPTTQGVQYGNTGN